MSGEGWNVLIVEGDASSARLASALAALPARSERVPTLAEATLVLGERTPDLVLCAATGPLDELTVLLQVAQAAGAERGPVPVILLAGDEPCDVGALLELGAEDVWPARLSSTEAAARLRRLKARRGHVDALLRENAVLLELAVTDALTQVANRRHFQERLAEEFMRAQRYDDPLAIILVDIDHFKQVNDRFGHPTGDRILTLVAGALRQAVRETDFVARYGGEEFGVLLPKTHLSGALTVAERVSDNVRRIRLDTDPAFRVTASFGVSGYPGRQVHSSDQLVATADDALLRAKGEGRNRIFLFQAPSRPPAEPALPRPGS